MFVEVTLSKKVFRKSKNDLNSSFKTRIFIFERIIRDKIFNFKPYWVRVFFLFLLFEFFLHYPHLFLHQSKLFLHAVNVTVVTVVGNDICGTACSCLEKKMFENFDFFDLTTRRKICHLHRFIFPSPKSIIF